MCLIIVKPKDINLPTEKILQTASVRNKDGIGIAYWKKDATNVHIKKDFKDFGVFHKFLTENITLQDSCIIHFRLATHGLVDEGNRHPFPVVQNKELIRTVELDCDCAAAHNGVLTQYSRLDDKELSDSQRFILDILGDPTVIGNVKSLAIQKLINEFLNRDKLALLFSDGDYLLFGDFTTTLGNHYSNQYSITTYDTTGYGYNRSLWNRQSHWDESPLPAIGFQIPRVNEASPIDKNLGINSCIGKCDGCYQEKLLRLWESSDKLAIYLLCKSCRKKAKKGNLDSIKEEVKNFLKGDSLIAEVRCHSCRDFFPSTELVSVCGGTMSVCSDCNKALELSQSC